MRPALVILLLTPTLIAQTNPTWTTPQPPFRIAPNLYYVGSQDLAAYLITTPAGNILINANLASSPPQIKHSIEQLGFRYADTKILLNSQAHYDHVAGLAQIAHETQAQVEVMDGDAQSIETGDKNDFGGPDLLPYPPVHVDRILHDRDTVTLGGITLTAIKTPGHTRGCTTWTMQATEAGRQLNVVILGAVSALSSYHLTPPESYPHITADFQQTFRTLQSLPVDIFLGAHGQFFDMQQKLRRLPKKGPAVWIDPTGYHRLITESQQAFTQQLAAQKH